MPTCPAHMLQSMSKLNTNVFNHCLDYMVGYSTCQEHEPNRTMTSWTLPPNTHLNYNTLVSAFNLINKFRLLKCYISTLDAVPFKKTSPKEGMICISGVQFGGH